MVGAHVHGFVPSLLSCVADLMGRAPAMDVSWRSWVLYNPTQGGSALFLADCFQITVTHVSNLVMPLYTWTGFNLPCRCRFQTPVHSLLQCHDGQSSSETSIVVPLLFAVKSLAVSLVSVEKPAPLDCMRNDKQLNKIEVQH